MLRWLTGGGHSIVAAVTTPAANIVMIKTTGNKGIGVVAITTILGRNNVVWGFASGIPAVVTTVATAGNVCVIKTGASKGRCIMAFTAVLRR